MFDTTNPDLSRFSPRGGKLILKGNGADYQRSVLQEITYYKSSSPDGRAAPISSPLLC